MKLYDGIFRTGRPAPSLLKGSISFPVYPLKWMAPRLAPPSLTAKLWWKVTVFRTKAKMHAYSSWRKPGNDGEGKDFLAQVMPLTIERFTKQRGWEVRPKQGEILFHRDKIGCGIVAHEAGHAATSQLRACARLEDRPVEAYLGLGTEIDDVEERLLLLQGSILCQITTAFIARKLW